MVPKDHYNGPTEAQGLLGSSAISAGPGAWNQLRELWWPELVVWTHSATGASCRHPDSYSIPHCHFCSTMAAGSAKGAWQSRMELEDWVYISAQIEGLNEVEPSATDQ